MAKRFSGKRPEDQPVFTNPADLDFEKRRIFFIKPTAGQMQLSFLTLTDTPDTYVDQANKFLKVTGAETGLEFAENDAIAWALILGG